MLTKWSKETINTNAFMLTNISQYQRLCDCYFGRLHPRKQPPERKINILLLEYKSEQF